MFRVTNLILMIFYLNYYLKLSIIFEEYFKKLIKKKELKRVIKCMYTVIQKIIVLEFWGNCITKWLIGFRLASFS